MPNYRQGPNTDFFNTRHYRDVVDALQIFSQDPLLFEPGTQFSYSSYGYSLLSAVIQQASSTDFLSFMAQEVWAPLAMLDTVANHRDVIIKHRAAPYVRRTADSRLINAPYTDNSNMWGGGGFLSTPSDLVRFGFGVLDGQLLDRQTIELLMTPQTTIDNFTYGLGWHSSADAGQGWIGHTGSSVGSEAVFLVHPESKVVFAVTCNVSDCFTGVRAEIESIGNLFKP